MDEGPGATLSFKTFLSFIGLPWWLRALSLSVSFSQNFAGLSLMALSTVIFDLFLAFHSADKL